MFYATIAGNTGKDATLRNANGTDVLGFSVAVTTGWGEREQTNWVNCSVWGARGAKLAQFLTKGTQVTCIGEMSTREYEGKTYLEMKVSEIKLQGKREGGTTAPAQSAPAVPAAQSGGYDNFDSEDVPFAPLGLQYRNALHMI